MILIDDLVVSNKHYKKAVDEYFKSLKQGGYDIVKMFENKDRKLVEKLNEIYFHTRQQVYCNPGNTNVGETLSAEDLKFNTEEFQKTFPKSSDITRLNCNNLNDKYLKDAIDSNSNIVLETTGITFPNWLFEHPELKDKLANYKIVCALSVVDISELLNRNIKRAIDSLHTYLKNSNITPPRLPEIDKDIYTENLLKIILTFREMITKLKKNQCFSDSIKQCNLLVYDNNGPTMKLLFNNDKTRLTNSVLKSFDITRNNILLEVIKRYMCDKCSNLHTLHKSTSTSKTTPTKSTSTPTKSTSGPKAKSTSTSTSTSTFTPTKSKLKARSI